MLFDPVTIAPVSHTIVGKSTQGREKRSSKALEGMAQNFRSPASARLGGEARNARRLRRTECARIDAELPEHLHVEIAERWRTVRVKGQMLAVLETAAGEEHRHVAVVVARRISEVR